MQIFLLIIEWWWSDSVVKSPILLLTIRFIEYLVKLLDENQTIYVKKDGNEEIYHIGLTKILEGIKDLKVKEPHFLLDKEQWLWHRFS